MRILITGPKLDEHRNVSGIATVVRQIIEHGEDEYHHFTAGREDGERTGALWFVKQFLLPLRFLHAIRKFRPDVVHINTALTERAILRDAVLAVIARTSRIPLVVGVHGGRYLVEEWRSRWLRSAARPLLTGPATLIVLSDHERQLILREWPDTKVCVLPNAVPADLLQNRQRANRKPVMVYLGRIHESKGLDELIEAARLFRSGGADLRLEAYGDGPMRETFVQQMKEALGEDFHYGGVVAGDAKWEVLRRADIFILPSRYGEGLPMAMLEAMGSGCIVIVSNVASVSSVLVDGSNGFLVEPRDAAGLSEKIKLVLARRADWPMIRENAVETVRSKFELTRYLNRLSEIYRETIDSN